MQFYPDHFTLFHFKESKPVQLVLKTVSIT